MSDAVLIAIISSAVSIIGAVIAWATNRNKSRSEVVKTDAEAAQIISEAARELVQPLKERIDEMESKLHTLQETTKDQESEIHGLKSLVGKLRAISKKLYDQVVAAGQKPNLTDAELKELG